MLTLWEGNKSATREREREKEPTNDRVNAKVLKSLKGVKLTKIFLVFSYYFSLE